MRLPKAEMERHLPADNAVSHFLAMMVRAPRAVDLVANSGLAVCSWVSGAGKLAFAASLGRFAAIRVAIMGG